MRPALFGLIAVGVLVIAGCSGGYEVVRVEPPQLEELIYSEQPLESTWSSTQRTTVHAMREHNDRIAAAVEAEREWCATQGDLIAESYSPPSPDEMTWMRQVAEATAQARGLTLERMPRIRIVSPQEWRLGLCRLLLEPLEVEEPWSPQQQTLERLLGFKHPQLTRRVETYLGRLATIGRYDGRLGPGVITLVADRPLPRSAAAVFSHEIVHALQDQHLAPTDAALDRLTGFDGIAAYQWLREGDAEVSALAVNDPALPQSAPPGGWGAETPSASELVGVVAAPASPSGPETYLLWRDAIAPIVAEQGYAALNRLLRDTPPRSTEQPLHPDRLAADEPPIHYLQLWQLLDGRCSHRDAERRVDMLGEYYLRSLIVGATGQPALARRAAAGWGQDIIWTYDIRRDGPVATVLWQIVFDSAADHAEGAEGMREWLIALSSGEAVAAENAPVTAWNGPVGAIRLVDHADTLWLIASDDAETADWSARCIVRQELSREWW